MSAVQSNKARIAEFLRVQYAKFGGADTPEAFYAWLHGLALDKTDLFHEEAVYHVLHDRTRRIIYPAGNVSILEKPADMSTLRALMAIGNTGLDTVNLRHMAHPLMVMVIPDKGWETKEVTVDDTTTLEPVRAILPVNPIATLLYHANCIPGTTHAIAGPAAIVADEDFA